MQTFEKQMELWSERPGTVAGVLSVCWSVVIWSSLPTVALCVWMLMLVFSFVRAHRLLSTTGKLEGVGAFVAVCGLGIVSFSAVYYEYGIVVPHSSRYSHVAPDKDGMCIIRKGVIPKANEEGGQVQDFDASKIRRAVQIDMVYFSLVTWTTLGYGDMRPAEAVRLYAGVESVCGYFTFGLLLTLMWTASEKSIRRAQGETGPVVFGDSAFYCVDTNRIVFLLSPITKQTLFNLHEVVKLTISGEQIATNLSVPILRQKISRLQFNFKLTGNQLVAQLQDDDVASISVVGAIGDTNFGTAKDYSAEEIVVVNEWKALKKLTSSSEGELDGVMSRLNPPITGPSLIQWVEERRNR